MNGRIGLCTKKYREYRDPESRLGVLGAEVKKTPRKITVVLLESKSDCTSHNPGGSPSPPTDPERSVTVTLAQTPRNPDCSPGGNLGGPAHQTAMML